MSRADWRYAICELPLRVMAAGSENRVRSGCGRKRQGAAALQDAGALAGAAKALIFEGIQSIPIDSNEFQTLLEKIMKPSTQNQNDGDLWQMRVGRGVGSVEVNQGAWVGRRGARGATRPTDLVPAERHLAIRWCMKLRPFPMVSNEFQSLFKK